MNTNQKGILLGIVGMMLLAPDALLIRLMDSDPFLITSLRAIFIALMIGILLIFFKSTRRHFRWKPVIFYGLSFAVGLVCFPLSIKTTYVANTLVIIAVTPILAAIGAYFILGEKTNKSTWWTAIFIFIGIAIIFGDSFSLSNKWGDILAVIVALALALNSIIIRYYRELALLPGVFIGALLVGLVLSLFADWSTLDIQNMGLLALDGGFIVGISFVFLIAAARVLPPAEFNLLFLLETIFAPLWVWLFIGEEPPPRTLIAAGFIFPSLLVYGWIRTVSVSR